MAADDGLKIELGKQGVFVTTIEELYNWGRRSSIWPMQFGLESRGDAWLQFHSAYYLYAIIFLIFDVEAVFLLPFAVAFKGLGIAASVAMLVFVLMLIEGLAWAWVKGVLTWA